MNITQHIDYAQSFDREGLSPTVDALRALPVLDDADKRALADLIDLLITIAETDRYELRYQQSAL